MKKNGLLLFISFLCLPLLAQETVNDELNEAIRKHGLEQSQVMDLAAWMTDVYGPRLTGSPMLDKATEWAVGRLKEMGMKNVHLDEWGPFGRGWEMQHFEIHAETPSYFPIIGYPKAWSPSTDGEVSGEVVYLSAANMEELETYRGKLEGKFVFLDTIRNAKEWFDGTASRRDSENLLEMANAPMPAPRRFRGRNSRFNYFTLSEEFWTFLAEEKPLAIIDRYFKGDQGTVFVSRARASAGSPWEEDQTVIPQVTISLEHYNRLFRLMQKDMPVKLSMELKAAYTNPDGMEHNIIAEIPGTDLKDEVVMFGAHFDSWHSGTGATDNAAGSCVMMEAARILQEVIKETGIKPRRTLRLALWTGEEQGLKGSRAYVKKHLAETGPNGNLQEVKPAQKNISAYYNLDNGTGRIRGVYLQGNPDVAGIFRAWLEPFKDLDAGTVTLRNTGGTDHLAFDAVNIPGFQFIQDPMAYSTRTHHSNMDNLDHLVEEDLKQAATIIASFVMHTAMRDDKLPRKKKAEDKPGSEDE